MSLNNLKISRKLTLGFAAVTVTMAGMGAATFLSFQSLETARRETDESRQTIQILNEAKFFLARQENSYRGFLLSAHPYYVERIAKHRDNFKQRLSAAAPLLADSPKDLETLTAIGAAAERLAGLTDWKSVQDSWRQALDKIHTDPEGAITATRTLLESTCKHICDERGVSYENNWDLSRLYKATAGAMEIAPDQHSEQVIKQILSGVSTVVTGLGSLRNSLSDAHGRGKRAVRPAPRHAKLAVNAGFAVAGFLIDTHIERPSPTVRS